MLCNAMAELKGVSESLDDSIHSVKLEIILPSLAKTMSLEKAVLEKAMVENKLKLSDVAIAKLLAEKSNSKIDNFLTPTVAGDWPGQLKKNNLTEQDAEDYLDNLQTEVALMMLDFREKRESRK